MKNKIFTLVSLLTSFLLGCVFTYIYMTKNTIDNMMQSSIVQREPTRELQEPDLLDAHGVQIDYDKVDKQDNEVYTTEAQKPQLTAHEDAANINNYTYEQAKSLVDDMPDMLLEQYIDKFMAKDATDVIADKRRFAERALEELYEPNDNQPLNGTIKLSLSSNMPSYPLDTSEINKYATLYAHLDTNGQTSSSPFVFVKWVNNQTGQILLFEKKNIIANSQQNWVSLRPHDGWQIGSYDIKFYQFNSQLEPIAQLTYHVYKVKDSS